MTEALIDPVVFNPYDYHFHDDPYPTYKRLREESPLYHNPDVGFWALSRYADVVDGFKDNKRLSSANGVSLDPAAYGPHAHYVMSFLAMDDPRHMRLRQLVSRGFTPRRVAELDGRILELTKQHLIPALGAGSSTGLRRWRESCRWTSSPNSWVSPNPTEPNCGARRIWWCIERRVFSTCRNLRWRLRSV